MDQLRVVYVVLFGGAGLACFGATLQTRRLASRDVRRGLVGLLVLSGLWAFAIVGQLLVAPVWLKALVYALGLVAGFGTVFAWLYFVSAYTGRRYHRHRRLRAAGSALFVLAALVKLTNPLHHAYFTTTVAETPFPHIAVDHGGIHWLLMGVAYALSAVGFWLLYDAFRTRETPLILYVLVGITAVPALPNLVGVVYPDLLLAINYEPLGVAVFAVGVLFFAEESLLKLSAPGSAHLIDALSEGVLLLGDDDTVVNYNDCATTVYPELDDGVHSLDDLDPRLAALEAGDQRVVTRTIDGRTRYFEATRRDIHVGPQFISTAITLAEVTRLARLKELRRVHLEVNEALVRADDRRELKEGVPDRLVAAEPYRFAWSGRVDENGVVVECVAGEPDDYRDVLGVGPSGSGTPDEREPVVRALDDGDRRFLEAVVDDDSASGPERRLSNMGVTAYLAVRLDAPDADEVVSVYTTDPDGFDDAERATFAELRETLTHALEALQAREEARRYQEAVDQSGYALYVTDADGVVQYVNPAFEEITGYPADEAVGRSPERLFADDTYVEDIEAVRESGTIREREVQNRRRTGEQYWARRTVAPVTDEESDVTGFVTIEVDVTERRLREQRLDVLNRVLRHNLRNDMSVITGYANQMLSEPASERDESVERPARRIRETATDLLQLSEKAHRAEKLVEANADRDAAIPLDRLLSDLERDLSARFPDSTVQVAPPETTTVAVNAALKPALHELAQNGLEHDEGNGRLRVDATLRTDPETDQQELEVTVVDDGPGLPDQERSVLEGDDESPLHHGSGLGLWLVNWLVLQCGGTVDVETDGDGTTVTVRVPVRADESARAAGEVVS